MWVPEIQNHIWGSCNKLPRQRVTKYGTNTKSECVHMAPYIHDMLTSCCGHDRCTGFFYWQAGYHCKLPQLSCCLHGECCTTRVSASIPRYAWISINHFKMIGSSIRKDCVQECNRGTDRTIPAIHNQGNVLSFLYFAVSLEEANS